MVEKNKRGSLYECTYIPPIILVVVFPLEFDYKFLVFLVQDKRKKRKKKRERIQNNRILPRIVRVFGGGWNLLWLLRSSENSHNEDLYVVFIFNFLRMFFTSLKKKKVSIVVLNTHVLVGPGRNNQPHPFLSTLCFPQPNCGKVFSLHFLSIILRQ